MLVPTRKWEADVELRPTEKEGVELVLVRLEAVQSYEWLSQETALLSHCSAEEGDVELRPSENKDVELTPPTVVQEEGVVEL